jgi:hypothetical protein
MDSAEVDRIMAGLNAIPEIQSINRFLETLVVTATNPPQQALTRLITTLNVTAAEAESCLQLVAKGLDLLKHRRNGRPFSEKAVWQAAGSAAIDMVKFFWQEGSHMRLMIIFAQCKTMYPYYLEHLSLPGLPELDPDLWRKLPRANSPAMDAVHEMLGIASAQLGDKRHHLDMSDQDAAISVTGRLADFYTGTSHRR